jgi:hypothetical protein
VGDDEPRVVLSDDGRCGRIPPEVAETVELVLTVEAGQGVAAAALFARD